MSRLAQKSVGEMISDHHWRDAASAHRQEMKAFYETDLGRSINAFAHAIRESERVGNMDYPSDRALKRAADREDEAERTLRTMIRLALSKARGETT